MCVGPYVACHKTAREHNTAIRVNNNHATRPMSTNDSTAGRKEMAFDVDIGTGRQKGNPHDQRVRQHLEQEAHEVQRPARWCPPFCCSYVLSSVHLACSTPDIITAWRTPRRSGRSCSRNAKKRSPFVPDD